MIMNTNARIAIAAAIIAAMQTGAFAQKNKSALEKRIADLEKRVARLETQMRGKAQKSRPASRKRAAAKPRPSVSSTSQQSRPVSYATHIPLSLKLVTKKLANASETGGSDEIRFFVQFKNTGEKDITSLEGDLVVKNINAKKLLGFGMSAAKFIAAGDSTIWIGALEYDPKETGHRSVLESDKSYLVVQLEPTMITYSDGTESVYRKEE